VSIEKNASHDLFYNFMLYPMIRPDRLRQAIDDASFTQSELARVIGIKQSSIAALLSGKAQSSKFLHDIARQLGVTVDWLNGATDDRSSSVIPDHQSRSHKRAFDNELAAGHMGLVGVREIDLTFGMGSTYLDVPVTEAVRYFSADWLRIYTRSSPDRLFFAEGLGDSMSPTILDSDLLLIDTGQAHVNMGDKIWAISFGDVGMIKRLRPLSDGSVEILSDNAQVPSIVAHDGEMTVLGRVVAVVRKV
jgi:phage repressor protein C with HTH and peptisase S24 domain